ncbi:MAG: hypothetical protein ABFE01_24735 [Phycisphaerales bacterium]
MSYSADKLRTQHLLNQLNERTRLFGALRGGGRWSWWNVITIGFIPVYAGYLIWESFDRNQAGAIFAGLTAVLILANAVAANVHQRVNALIEILQQEGLLDSTRPIPQDKERQENPPED